MFVERARSSAQPLGTPEGSESRISNRGKADSGMGVPPLQIAQQLIAANDLQNAVPYSGTGGKVNPRAVGIHWSLARLYRLLGRGQEFLQLANSTIALDRNYAPIYSELGQYYEATREFAKAAQAYDSYLLLLETSSIAPRSGDERNEAALLWNPAQPQRYAGRRQEAVELDISVVQASAITDRVRHKVQQPLEAGQ